MLVRSLKWQIQAWHTLLLIVIVGGLLTAFYFYEKRVQVELLDEKLRAPIHQLLPMFDLPRGVEQMREQMAAQENTHAEQEDDHERPVRAFDDSDRRPEADRDEGDFLGPRNERGPRGGGLNSQRRPRPSGFGPRDGGPRDGGPRDGGPRDGGPRDGGPRDGGSVDEESGEERPHTDPFLDRPARGDLLGGGQNRPREPRRGQTNGESRAAGNNAFNRLQNENRERLTRHEANGLYIIYWREGEVFYQTEGSPESVAPSDRGVEPRRPEDETNLQGPERDNQFSGVFYRWNGKHREFLQHTPRGWLLTGISTDVIDEHMAMFKWQLIGLGAAVIGFGVAVGWIMAARAMKPIASMSSTATKIAAGDLSQRIDETNTKNELGQLAHVLNDTFGRLDSSFEQQVRFTADASHEMRTPLAVILAKSELALVRERTPEKYQETIKTCYDSAQHMSSLIESLLELARVDSGEFKVQREQGNIGLEVSTCVDMLRPLAEKRGITMKSDIQGIEMEFDAQRIRQVVINLLSNAVKYNHEQGNIFVRVRKEDDEAVISVQDTGPGIKPDDLKNIFNRFYRVDKSRNSKQGSTGLGLAISQAIVQAHEGRLEAESDFGAGTTFRMRLPLK